MREIVIEKNDAGQRTDRFLKKYLRNAPLSAVYKLLRKDVKLRGAEDEKAKKPKEDYILSEGDVLLIYTDDALLDEWTEKKQGTVRSKRQFKILYEDESLIAVNKPFGLLVHGDKNEKKDTLANQVRDYLIESGSYNPRAEKSFVPSPVHRLDRNTTGIVVFGKTAEGLRHLSEIFREEHGENVRKFYYTIVHGCLDKDMDLKAKLLKDEKRNIGRVLPLEDERGKYVETVVHPVAVSSDRKFSLVEIELITGRSHQIRAQLSACGHPLVGDTKYGGREVGSKKSDWSLGRTTQALHAHKIILEGTEITAPLPASWESMQKELLGRVFVR